MKSSEHRKPVYNWFSKSKNQFAQKTSINIPVSKMVNRFSTTANQFRQKADIAIPSPLWRGNSPPVLLGHPRTEVLQSSRIQIG